MPTWLIIVLAAIVVLAVGGYVARRMWLRRTEAHFRVQLEKANHDLAEAAAVDRGWDRDTLEAAARSCYAQQRGREPAELLLVEVLDRPGTKEDFALFRVESEGHKQTLTLGRRDGDWVLESLE